MRDQITIAWSVMRLGQLVEVDTPLNLLRNEASVFRQMCMKTAAFEDLLAAAERAHLGS